MFGGHIEYGERPDSALRRELREETLLSTTQIGRMALGSHVVFELCSQITGRGDVRFHVFFDEIIEPFEATDGATEVHSMERLDAESLSPALTYILETEHMKRRVA